MIGATLVAMEVSVCTKLQTLSSDHIHEFCMFRFM